MHDSLPAPYVAFCLMISLWFQECLDFCCIQLCPNPFATFSKYLWPQIPSQKAKERLSVTKYVGPGRFHGKLPQENLTSTLDVGRP